MLWLNPSALFALAAIAAPILIHILVHRRAERLPFPTLRFLQPTRLAAIRRHVVDDLPLLIVRALLIAAAVGALAAPLLVTAGRTRAWDRRVVRAVVTDAAGAQRAPDIFAAASLRDALDRALVWLDTAPPARREIVIASSLPIGSISAVDIDRIPADIGVRFERTGALPPSRTVAGGRVLTADGVRAREITFEANRTAVRDQATPDPVAWPIDVVSAPADRTAVSAAIAAVLSQRVWAGPPDRAARVVLLPVSTADLKVRTTLNAAADLKARTTSDGATDLNGLAPPEVQPPSRGFGEPRRSSVEQQSSGGGAFRPAMIQQPWMADAVARMAADVHLRDAASRVPAGLADPAFSTAPWQTVASAADGRPLAVAAGSAERLLVASAGPATDIITPMLLRAIANAIAPRPDLQRGEVTPIADAVLQQWSRPAAPLTKPRLETVARDDRRWLWLAALALFAVEAWLRRSRVVGGAGEMPGEKADVA